MKANISVADIIRTIREKEYYDEKLFSYDYHSQLPTLTSGAV